MRFVLELDARRPAAEELALAAAAERAGWDGVRVADDAGGAECWALAGALAAAVPRLRLQVVVDPARGRHPAVVAKLASTVDQLSQGRLLLGFLPDGPARGEARLAEAVTVVKSLARGGPATWRGQFFRLQDAPLDPPAVQQPFPVMLVGGTATQAAAWADHWSVSGSPAAVAEQVDQLAAACRVAERALAGVAISAVVESPATPGDYLDTGAVEVVIGGTRLGADPAECLAALAALSPASAWPAR